MAESSFTPCVRNEFVEFLLPLVAPAARSDSKLAGQFGDGVSESTRWGLGTVPSDTLVVGPAALWANVLAVTVRIFW